MKNYYLLGIITFILFSNICFAQINLVPNQGFDSVDCTSEQLYHWDLQGFTFAANTCFPFGGSPRANHQPPDINPAPFSYSTTYQQPLTNGGFIGMGVYGAGSRGYAVAELKHILKPNTEYYCRFNVAPHYPDFNGFKWVYTDAIGMSVMYREKKFQYGDNFYRVVPIIEHHKLLRDTQNWTRVNGKYLTGLGEEKYVVIGNFREDRDSKVDTNGFHPWAGVSNVFYIDDVVLSEFNPLPDSALLCTNETKTLNATFYDNPTYEWSDGSTQPTFKVTTPGRYWVRIRIDDLYFSDTITVVPEKGYKGLPKDTVVCERGPPVVLGISVEAQYKWSTGQTSRAIAVNKTGHYTVTVTTPQCTLQFSTDVEARNCFCNFYTPTAFSPNGDGVNDTFKPFIDCKVIYIKDYKFSIYNRYGELLFSTNKLNDPWDGTYKGLLASVDTYVWVVQYKTYVDKDLFYDKIVESGDVTIIK